jgi:hypothetical protein
MTPHAYYTSSGTLTETYLASAGWTSRYLAGRPAAGSAIVADARASGPEMFYFGADGQLTSSAEMKGTWSAASTGGPPTTRPGSLALGSTVSGPELFYLDGHGIMAAASTGRGWATAPVASPSGVAADSPLAAVSAGAHQVNVFFIDGRGKLAEAAQDQRGWQVSEVPGAPAPGTSLAATSYLPGPQSTAAGPVPLGTAVYYLTRSGQPATTYADAGQPWRSAALPGRATGILGADAYQTARQPSRVFLSGPLGLDEASHPGGAWTAQSLAPSSVWLSPAALWLAASCLAGSCLAALWLVRRRLVPR